MRPAESASARVLGEQRAIDYGRTMAFFEERAATAEGNALTATMYQDEELARRRDQAEKDTVLRRLHVRADDRVLDLGCGSGRWAQVIASRVSVYLGVDFSARLLEIARVHAPDASFECAAVNALEPETLAVPPPYTLIICSGILTYLNDSDVDHLFSTVSRTAAARSRIYVREPIAKTQRLTLDDYWSEELRSQYSAVYRTRGEYLGSFGALTGFQLKAEGEPFPKDLQNRPETEQRYFLLERAPR
jgi:cyclopropane fatty-acyl-phospholipid synthase-like methyltransferase